MQWILKERDDGRETIKLDRDEFNDMGPLSRDSRCNIAVKEIGKDSIYLLVG